MLDLEYKKPPSFLNYRAVVIATIIGAVVVILIFLLILNKRVNVQNYPIYEIAHGATSYDIAKDLARKKIISSPLFFQLYLKIKRLDRNLQAGRFTFPKEEMSLKELVEFLTSGAEAKEVLFTVPEGYTVEQIDKILKEKGLVEGYEFIGIAGSRSLKYEGYLFPDTYRVYTDSTADEIIQKMFDNFQKKTDPLLPDIERQGRKLDEIIIMASILEREVQIEDDMKKVADILWRRMDTGWKLETDSTLNYILSDKKPALSADDLKVDSPYNTYLYNGFPPTPIGNPGLKAIKAAIYPTQNEYWFYLTARDGSVIYAKTFEEQVVNKKKYLQ